MGSGLSGAVSQVPGYESNHSFVRGFGAAPGSGLRTASNSPNLRPSMVAAAGANERIEFGPAPFLLT